MSKTIFYIVRHGQSVGNVLMNQGVQLEEKHWNSELTDVGREQAREIARTLTDIRFDAIFSSDLLRAKQTADIIATEHKMAVVATAAIRESNSHSFYHYPEEKRKQMRDLIDQLTEEEKMTFRAEKGMETYQEAATRLLNFLREIAIAYEGKTILVVAHGTIMRAFLMNLGYATYGTLASGSIKNTGYIILESDGVEFFVKETHFNY